MDANIISYLFSVGAYLYFFCGYCSYHVWLNAPELVHSLPPSIVEGINFFAPSDFYGKAAADTSSAILTDIALMLLFIVPHIIFANNMLRTKDILPTCLERPFFVLQAQLMLHIQMMYWKPFGVTLYDVRGTPLGTTLSALSTVGFAFILTSSFALDHFHLFGISQGFGVDVNKMVGLAPSDTSEGGLSTRWHYSIVAHPIMAGMMCRKLLCPADNVHSFLLTYSPVTIIHLHCIHRVLGLSSNDLKSSSF